MNIYFTQSENIRKIVDSLFALGMIKEKDKEKCKKKLEQKLLQDEIDSIEIRYLTSRLSKNSDDKKRKLAAKRVLKELAA